MGVNTGIVLALVFALFLSRAARATICRKVALNNCAHFHELLLVAGEGFEPSKAEPGDLQSPPIGRSGNPPRSNKYCGNYG